MLSFSLKYVKKDNVKVRNPIKHHFDWDIFGFFPFSFCRPLLPPLLLTKGVQISFESDLNLRESKEFGVETMELFC